jgi:hypothetical protein
MCAMRGAVLQSLPPYAPQWDLIKSMSRAVKASQNTGLDKTHPEEAALGPLYSRYGEALASGRSE